MFVRTDKLDENQLHAVDQLCFSCQTTDGFRIPLYRSLLEHLRPSTSMILAYDEAQLVGFLSVYFFYDNACEMALLVDPTHRRQGIAAALLADMRSHLDASIQHIIFSSPQGIHADWLPMQGLSYKSSDYEMILEPTTPQPIDLPSSCIIRSATTADIPTLCLIDRYCFPEEQTTQAIRLLSLLADPHYRLFVAEQQGILVGKVHLQLQATGTRLSDLAVLPSAQGQGIGRALLTHCIHQIVRRDQMPLILDVETTNQQALSLYTRLGFKISNACDYWVLINN